MPSGKERAFRVAKLAARDGFRCWLCHGEFHTWTDITIDHAIPRARGGGNHLPNLRLAHLKCNGKRGAIAKTKPKAAQERLRCIVELTLR